MGKDASRVTSAFTIAPKRRMPTRAGNVLLRFGLSSRMVCCSLSQWGRQELGLWQSFWRAWSCPPDAARKGPLRGFSSDGRQFLQQQGDQKSLHFVHAMLNLQGKQIDQASRFWCLSNRINTLATSWTPIQSLYLTACQLRRPSKSRMRKPP